MTQQKHAKKQAANRRENPWILELLDNPNIANELTSNQDLWATKDTNSGLCVICKGSRMLCGKTRCPVMVRVNSFIRAVPLIKGLDIDGASPLHGILHKLGEVKPEDVKIGMKVKAVWKPAKEREGAITDIKYFKPIKEAGK